MHHFFKMQVHYNLQLLPSFRNAVITIGTFDGVHSGHRQIIELMKKEAALVNGETVIITFHPHPRHVISNKNKVYLINTLDEKLALLQQNGIDHVVVVPFTESFAQLSAEAYIHDFLVKTFRPHTIIIGHDHRFGKDRQGNFQLLEDKAKGLGYAVKEIPGYMMENMTISSTRIREALLKGDVATANHFLGYTYFFSGIVVEGNKLGRTIGYPTANIKMDEEDKLVPGNGVYAVEVSSIVNGSFDSAQDSSIGSLLYKGMMNIGVRPTVDGTKRVIEVNIFDFDADIYGQHITIKVKRHLRDEQKFNGLDELKAQLARDKQEAMRFEE